MQIDARLSWSCRKFWMGKGPFSPGKRYPDARLLQLAAKSNHPPNASHGSP
jgi:hypothetical protein